MGRTGRWLIALAAMVVVLGVSVWLADVFLPWDEANRVVAGTALGVALDAGIGVWANADIEAAVVGSSQPDPGEGSQRPSQSVGGSGFNISIGRGGQNFKGANLYFGTPPPPPAAPDGGSKGTEQGGPGVVRPKAVRLGEIPTEPPGYQPRPDLLQQLEEAAASGVAVVHALTGLRGVGKTQLAAAYARTRIADGWPVVAWINGETLDQLITGLADLADHFRLRAPGDDSATAARTAKAWLQTTERPALLVIDNADDPEALRPWLPAPGRTQVVITTTNQAFTTLARPVDVTVFTPAQAAAYLVQQTGLDDPNGAAAVADALGHLPLALAQAAWLITNQGKTYADYLTQLRARPLTRSLRATAAYPRGAAEAILLSVHQAERADPTGTTHRLLHTLALLSPTGVPRTLLDHLTDASDDQVDDALGTLAQASLITYTIDHTGVIMHRLVQHTLRDHARATGTLDATAARIARTLLAHTIPEGQAWSRRTEATHLIDQITALTDHNPLVSADDRGQGGGPEAATPPLTGDHDTTSADPPPLLALRAWALGHLVAACDLDRAITLGTAFAADTQIVLGDNHSLVPYVLDQLAAAHRRSGHHSDAVTLGQQAVAVSGRVLGPDHPQTLASQVNLATAYRDIGRFDDAITLHQHTLACSERVLGRDHPHTLSSSNELALAYLFAGHRSDAVSLLKQSLADNQRVLGPDHPQTLRSRGNLALAYRHAGRLDDAVAVLEQVLADSERVLGPDHPQTLLGRNNIAVAYRHARRFHDAVAVLEQALADCERVLGPHHSQTFGTRSNLAEAYASAGRLDDAVAVLEQVLADSERLLGPDHPYTLLSRKKLVAARPIAILILRLKKLKMLWHRSRAR